MSIQAWLKQVDNWMLYKHGVGIDDIPDMPWDMWYNAAYTYKKATKLAIDKVNNGGF